MSKRHIGKDQVMSIHCINEIPSGFISCILDYLCYTLGDVSAWCHTNRYQEPGSSGLLFFTPACCPFVTMF